MNTFDKIIFDQLEESIVNIPREELDETVFTYKENGLPILRDAIKIQILKDIDQIQYVCAVDKFLIIGSILTKNYDDNCDIDVSIHIAPETVDSIVVAELMHTLVYMNGKLAYGTTHPINYYILTHDFDEDKADAIYDIINERWIKIPENYSPDVEKWVSKFQDTMTSIDVTTGSLHRDLVDLDEIRHLDTKDIKKLRLLVKRKLGQMEELLNHLTSTYKNVKSMRDLAFDQFMTPQELQLYGSRNKLPENILYKLLEKYYYIKFIKKIESILDDKDALELTDIPKIKKAMGDLWKTS